MTMVYIAWLLDILGFKSISRKLMAHWAKPHHSSYVVYSGAIYFLNEGEISKAKNLLFGAWEKNPTARCGRLLMHILIREKNYQMAAAIAEELAKKSPENPWPFLLYGDIQNFFLKDREKAHESYLKALEIAKSRAYGVNPLKVAYKRVVKDLEDNGNDEELIAHLLEFMNLQPSNFHDHEFDLLTRKLLQRKETEKAREVINLGLKAYPRSLLLRRSYEELGFGSQGSLPEIPLRGKPTPFGIETIPVRTRLLLEGDDPVDVVKQFAADVRKDDIVTLSSCVAGLMEGRIFMEGAIEPGFLAKILSKFVDQKNIPFGGAAPMSNPLSMEVLIEEIGSLRTLAAALSGAVGKLLGKKGWFYVVGGKDAGQIDDVLGSLPPYDYYVIMGPKDPDGLSQRMAETLGCHGAIVDANDLGVAWAVGRSGGVDPRWLEDVMSQNPAGNQEQRTPIVIVRRKKECGEENF